MKILQKQNCALLLCNYFFFLEIQNGGNIKMANLYTIYLIFQNFILAQPLDEMFSFFDML
jgi:hypothetical protein